MMLKTPKKSLKRQLSKLSRMLIKKKKKSKKIKFKKKKMKKKKLN